MLLSVHVHTSFYTRKHTKSGHRYRWTDTFIDRSASAVWQWKVNAIHRHKSSRSRRQTTTIDSTRLDSTRSVQFSSVACLNESIAMNNKQHTCTGRGHLCMKSNGIAVISVQLLYPKHRWQSCVIGWLLISIFSNLYSCCSRIPWAVSSTVNWWPGGRRTRGSSCKPHVDDWLAWRWIINDDRCVTRPVKNGMKQDILRSATAKIREFV